jgi:hypothetical protein
VAVNEDGQEHRKSVVVSDYNIVLAMDPKDRRLQLYLLERKKGTKWYLKLFQKLLSIAIHDAMNMYQSLLKSKTKYSLKFRLSLLQELAEKTRPWWSLFSTQPSIN